MELIDGNQIAAAIIAELKTEVAAFAGRKPCLALVRVGEDPASVSYVRKKEKTAAEIGVTSRIILPPITISQAELLQLIDELNADSGVDGILVQSPLPKAIDEVAGPALDLIAPHGAHFAVFAVGTVRKTPHGWTAQRFSHHPERWCDPTPERSGVLCYLPPYQTPPPSALIRTRMDDDLETWVISTDGTVRYERRARGIERVRSRKNSLSCIADRGGLPCQWRALTPSSSGTQIAFSSPESRSRRP